MARKFIEKIVTANALLQGDVIYFTKQNVWSRNHQDAIIAHTIEQANELLEKAEQQQDIIVGAYLADVFLDEAKTASPLHFREIFRSKGPSNYFHGKQTKT
ncbi:MAG: DUF2849 domain-containing protein [Devosiaceae bacterium]|nr:DUF2849 domain-containing protein [Devosiaceae bacterium]